MKGMVTPVRSNSLRLKRSTPWLKTFASVPMVFSPSPAQCAKLKYFNGPTGAAESILLPQSAIERNNAVEASVNLLLPAKLM
jgi:hypothetical protein